MDIYAYRNITTKSHSRNTNNINNSQSAVEKILSGIECIINRISSSSAVKVIKALAVFACLFGFVAVIAGIEQDLLSPAMGICLSAFMVFIEIMCFHTPAAKSNKSNRS